MLEVCHFKEIKVSKEFLLKSDGIKRNDENKIKINDGIPSHHGSENEGTCFYW